jgi:hypothetical protein
VPHLLCKDKEKANLEEVSMSKHTDQPAESGIGRWLRVGFFAFTVLGPAINTILERTVSERERRRARLKNLASQAAETQPASEQDEAVKPSLSESLLELPYAQVLVKRGEDFANDLRERGGRLSQSVAEHGGKVTHDLIDRSSELTRDLIGRGGQTSQEMLRQSEKAVKELRKQSEKAARTMRKESEKAARRLTKQSQRASKELTRRSEKISRELVRRSQEFTHELAERNGRAWAILGFGIGLISASAAVYVLLSKRMRQIQEEEAEQHILITPGAYQNSSAEAKPLARQNGNTARTESATLAAPANAALVGIVSTRRYYPVSTPLDQLQEQSGATGKPADLIYFSSVEEAKSQGFSAADEDQKNS